MRQVLSTAITAFIVAALTAVTVSALAQDAPTTERTISPAAVSNINAHRVDGKHAVGFTNKPLARRYKLVATNKQGLLPSNIVKPLWGAIKNKPAGFADGVDDGITGLKVTKVIGPTGPICTADTYCTAQKAVCPSGSVMVGGGSAVNGVISDTALLQSYPMDDGWYGIAYRGPAATSSAFLINYALCLSIESGGPISVASKGRAVDTSVKKGK